MGFFYGENMAELVPSFNDFKALSEKGNLIPIYQEVDGALETPLSAYLKIGTGNYSFLLESVEGGERMARYSFIGTNPYKVLKTGPLEKSGAKDPLPDVESELGKFHVVPVKGLPRFLGGAVGYLSYDCAHHFEPKIPSFRESVFNIPESVFMFADTLLVFDHLLHKIKVVSHAHVKGDSDEQIRKAYEKASNTIKCLVQKLTNPLPSIPSDDIKAVNKDKGSSNKTSDQYIEMVQKAREYIIAGDVIQVVPSQRIAKKTSATAFELYRALRGVNPSPYMYMLELEDFAIVGASPEMLVRVEDEIVETHPIAGTRRRGLTDQEDQVLESELRGDEKEIAEHVMLLDLGRNDIGRVAEPGSVTVTQMLEIERYSHVMHLVSHVTGKLDANKTAYDALRACFPAGTVSGAPKIRAMEIIAELEGEARGPYAGAVGYFSFDGNMDTAIAIRTMVLKDNTVYVQAGGGVVYDSDPDLERQESLQKMAATLRAIEIAEGRSI
tara:strand:+ start:8316 stop:9806 length:1491 start_codon:yes stop_codon:yes gene_type:complete